MENLYFSLDFYYETKLKLFCLFTEQTIYKPNVSFQMKSSLQKVEACLVNML